MHIALLVLGELDNGLLIYIAMFLAFDGIVVPQRHLCSEAGASRAEPKQEKTHNREPGKDAMGRKNHESDCSD